MRRRCTSKAESAWSRRTRRYCPSLSSRPSSYLPSKRCRICSRLIVSRLMIFMRRLALSGRLRAPPVIADSVYRKRGAKATDQRMIWTDNRCRRKQAARGRPHFAPFKSLLSRLPKIRRPEALFADLRLALGIAIFSKSPAHGHCLESLPIRLIQRSQRCPQSSTRFDHHGSNSVYGHYLKL